MSNNNNYELDENKLYKICSLLIKTIETMAKEIQFNTDYSLDKTIECAVEAQNNFSEYHMLFNMIKSLNTSTSIEVVMALEKEYYDMLHNNSVELQHLRSILMESDCDFAKNIFKSNFILMKRELANFISYIDAEQNPDPIVITTSINLIKYLLSDIQKALNSIKTIGIEQDNDIDEYIKFMKDNDELLRQWI